MNNSKIKITEIIDAEVEKVWNYYNEPSHIVNWNFADPSWHCPSAENDLSIGGTYKARMEAKDGSFGFDFEAIYTEISKGKSFAYEFGGRAATVENPIEMQRECWKAILTNFKNYTENN